MRVKDHGFEIFFLIVPKMKFGGANVLKEGEIVRIRSVQKDESSRRNVIVCKAITNIIRFLSCSKIVIEMQRTIENLKDSEKIIFDDAGEVLMNPITLTEPTKNY